MAAALVWGYVAPSWFCRGRFAVGVTRGDLELTRATVAVVRVAQGWVIKTPAVNAMIRLESVSFWRPNIASGTISFNNGGVLSSYPVDVLYVPLWPWLIVTSGLGGFLWWKSGRVAAPGHCQRCGYSLAGLGDARCPECGEAVGTVIAAT